MVPAEFVVLSIFISQATNMTDNASLQKHLKEVMELDEARFLAEFHQFVVQRRQKAWHDKHIKKKSFTFRGQVLLYENKFQKFPSKLQMHCLSMFIVAEMRESGVVKLAQLDGILILGWVNGAHLKPLRQHNTQYSNL